MRCTPVNPGHVLIVPTHHVPDLAALEASSLGERLQVGQHIAAALRRSGLRCEGINLFLADGEGAGQEIPHVHLHARKALDDAATQIRAARR